MGIDGCVFACHTCALFHTHIVGEIAQPTQSNGNRRYDEDGAFKKRTTTHRVPQPILWHVMLESMKSQTSKHPNMHNSYRHSSAPEYFSWSISCISTANIRSTTKYLCEDLWASSLEKQFIQNCVIWQTRSPSLCRWPCRSLSHPTIRFVVIQSRTIAARHSK